jgi:hypothetical protein
LDQIHVGWDGAPGSYTMMRLTGLRLWNLETTLEIAKMRPGLLPKEEAARLEQRTRDVLDEMDINSRAEQRVQHRTAGRDSPWYMGCVMAMNYSQRALPALVVLGAVLIPLIRIVRGGRRPLTELSRARHLAFVLASFSLTFLLLGMFPAEVIGPDAQQATVVGLSLVIVLPALVFLWRFCLRLLGRFQADAVRLPVLGVLTVVTIWQAAVALFAVLNRRPIDAAVEWFSVQVLVRLPDWLLAVLTVLASLLCAFVVRAVWRRYRDGKPLVTPASVTAGLLLAATLLVVNAVYVCPELLDSGQLVPQHGADELRVWMLEDAFGEYVDDAWRWAVLQWIAYGGTYAASAGAMALAALWITLCHFRRPASVEDRPERGRCRIYWGSVLSCVRRSAWLQSGCLLIVYLVVAPRAVEQAEATYQFHRRCIEAPETFRIAVMAEADALRRDRKTIQAIRASVE